MAILNEREFTTFRTHSYTFTSGVLDNLSNVDIRIHFVEAIDIAASAKFDDLLVTAEAIPESGSVALLAGGAVLAAAAFVRRKR